MIFMFLSVAFEAFAVQRKRGTIIGFEYIYTFCEPPAERAAHYCVERNLNPCRMALLPS